MMSKPNRTFDLSSLLLVFAQMILVQRICLDWLVCTSNPFPYPAAIFTTLCGLAWVLRGTLAPVVVLVLAIAIGVVTHNMSDWPATACLLALLMPLPKKLTREPAALILAAVGLAWLVVLWPHSKPLTLEGLLGPGQSSGLASEFATNWGYCFALVLGPGVAAVLLVAATEMYRDRQTPWEVARNASRVALALGALLVALRWGAGLFDTTRWAGTVVFSASLLALNRLLRPVEEGPAKPGPKLRRWAWLSAALVLVFAIGYGWAYQEVNAYARRPKPSGFVPLAGISRELLDATVAMEDGSFYHHRGFDFVAMHRALRVDLRQGGIAQGGSTITQQLAKNAFLEQDRTVWRKIREAFLTLALEAALTKGQILERYVNTIDYGLGRRGIAQAARGYFHKSPRQLTLAEASYLVGLVPKPPRSFEELGRAEDLRSTALARIDFFFPGRYSLGQREEAQQIPLIHMAYPYKDQWDRYAEESLPERWNGVRFYFDLAPAQPLPIEGMSSLLKKNLMGFLSYAHRNLKLVGMDHIGVYNDRLVRGSTDQTSAHAFGQAIDISGFRFADGGRLRVTDHHQPDAAKRLLAMEAVLKRYFPIVVDWREDPKRHDNHFHAEVRGPRQYPYREPSP